LGGEKLRCGGDHDLVGWLHKHPGQQANDLKPASRPSRERKRERGREREREREREERERRERGRGRETHLVKESTSAAAAPSQARFPLASSF
jgi:hypothetical protein